MGIHTRQDILDDGGWSSEEEGEFTAALSIRDQLRAALGE